MAKNTIDLLVTKKDGFYVDGTGGGAGHSLEILKRIVPDGKLIFIDRDPQAIEQAEKELLNVPHQLCVVQIGRAHV